MRVDDKLREALALQRQGRWDLVEIICRDVLRHAPAHPKALALAGLVEAQKGHLDQACDLLEQAVAADPAQPGHFFNLGLIRQQQGGHALALAAFDRTLALAPGVAAAHHARGLALKNLDRLEEALAAYDQALALQPGWGAALNNRAAVLRRLGRLTQAIEGYEAALACDARLGEVWVNLGVALHEAGRDEQSLHAFLRARELGDRSVETCMNAGVALNALHRYAQALPLLEEARQLAPDDVDVRLNLGNALAGMDRRDEALAHFHAALARRPDDGSLMLNIANALRDGGQCDQALDWYARALDSRGAEDVEVRWNRSLCLLTAGDFQQGWRDYEARLLPSRINDSPRVMAMPRWHGDEPVAGRTVLLVAEQGLGDTLQFCRYARLVSGRGARVALEVQAPLVPLVQGLDGVSQVISRGQALPPADYYCPLMSLPLALGTTLQTIPAAVPYLRADAALVERWRRHFSGRTRLQVGVAWSGNAGNWNDHRRSIELARFRALLPACADYWSLQKESPPEQEGGARIEVFGETAFAHTAAQIMALDLVVSVDTSIAHLAGALGRPVWVLLPAPADMRWLLQREDTPWYPTMRLFRQTRSGDWASVLERVAREIEAFAAGR